MYKILVTGATGGLGRNLIEKLHSLKQNVTASGRNDAVGTKLAAQGIKFVKCDLTNEADVFKLVKGHNYVVHAAALSSPWGKYDDFYQNNVIATRNISKACLKHNVERLIHISSPSIYFDFTDRLDIYEDASLPSKFVNHYAATKFLAEEEIDNAIQQGLAAITLRPRAIFGKYDAVLLPRIIKVAKKGYFFVFNEGKNIIDVTCVDNVVHAILLALSAPKTALGQKFNITNDTPVAFKYLLERIFKRLSLQVNLKNVNFDYMLCLAKIIETMHKIPLITAEPIITQYGVGVLAKSQTLNIEKAKKLLGYAPIISIEDGINLYAALS